MTTRVLIIGGYGNFGRFISSQLACDTDIQLIIAGRSIAKAEAHANELAAEAVALDIEKDLPEALSSVNPDVVIHTSGPYQEQNYRVAEACIKFGCHYIDLADGREFVENITTLDAAARKRNVLVISGASTLPGFSSALVDHFLAKFERLESLDYAITTAQRLNPGVATIAAIFSYTGKPFQTLVSGRNTTIFGLQDLHSRKFPGAGRRYLGNCNVPDLTLFPKRYADLKSLRFYAGADVPLVQFIIWGISWLARWGLIHRLERAAAPLLKASHLVDWLGSDVSAFTMTLRGVGDTCAGRVITFDLVAKSGHGPNIPCVPAILLTQKIARGEIREIGAHPCIRFITLDEYLSELETFNISWAIT